MPLDVVLVHQAIMTSISPVFIHHAILRKWVNKFLSDFYFATFCMMLVLTSCHGAA